MKTRLTQQRWLKSAGVACLAVALGACGRDPEDTTRAVPGAATEEPVATPGGVAAGPVLAVAELSPTEGHHVSGTVRFVREGAAVRVIANLSGLSPGEHGFHIHENGDCSAPDASSAGGHFNPDGAPHGPRDAPRRHVGDLGNITADEQGNAHLDVLDPLLELTGEHSILNRAVVVHAGRDDLTSQPAGDAGARVACGVIQAQ